MELDEYQKIARSTAMYPAAARGTYPLLGLIGEVGELVEKAREVLFPEGTQAPPFVGLIFSQMKYIGELAERTKKLIRDGGPVAVGSQDMALLSDAAGRFIKSSLDNEVATTGLVKEGGDIEWYLANFLHDLDTTLEKCCQVNVAKLRSRKERGAIKGSGDER